MSILFLIIPYAIGAIIGEFVHLKYNATDYEKGLMGFLEDDDV